MRVLSSTTVVTGGPDPSAENEMKQTVSRVGSSLGETAKQDMGAMLQNLVSSKKKEEEEKITRMNFKKALYKHITVRVAAKPQVSMMAQAMRFWFIKALKDALNNGSVRSKYLFKFEIIDVISPKSFVILPKGCAVQSDAPMHRKFIFKQIHKDSIDIFCGTSTPTVAQVNSIIDPWINLVPKTPHIVTAYEVYKDFNHYMQLTEFADGYDNVYNRLKKAKFGMLVDQIPRQLIRMVYLFIIQISHALSYAHSKDLTHGEFDLTQVVLD